MLLTFLTRCLTWAASSSMTDSYDSDMAVGKNPPHDGTDQIVLKAVHDRSGWRVVLHIHGEGTCTTLEGSARFADEATCHEHGRALHHVLDAVIGLVVPEPTPSGTVH